MKRLKIILAVIVVFSFVGCSDEVEYIWDEESRINEYATILPSTRTPLKPRAPLSTNP